MLTASRFGEGRCVWCCQTTEGLDVKFKDGFQGFLCKKDFWAAVKARSEDGKEESGVDGARRGRAAPTQSIEGV